MTATSIMIIAGEASGDLHGANLARAIQKRTETTDLFGVGGDAMRKSGVRLLLDAKTLSVMGITEVISKLPTILQAMGTVKRALKHEKPDLLILIDFPDFNLRMAAAAKKRNIPVLYYISPQIWAWRQRRVKKIKRLVDHMAVILPFEAAFYQDHQVPVTFVGHPLLDNDFPQSPGPATVPGTAPPVIGLLPGSRTKEVTGLLPVMLQAATIIHQSLPAARFKVSCAVTIGRDLVQSIVRRYAAGLDIEVTESSVTQIFGQSQILVAASGTVTLEAALNGVPTVIIYKISPLSYWLAKRLIKVKYIGIANLIVDKEVLPELIQEKASPQTLADTVLEMFLDKERLAGIREELQGVRNLLGEPGAADRVAGIALDLVQEKRGKGGRPMA
jgi:lipid-A-disaccharide synthase